jgi:hypothetical protein
MNNKNVSGVHYSFWIISIVTLIWNVMGLINYVMQMNPEALSSYPESHRAIIEGRPWWATGGFAIAVFGGTLGCLLLLLKKSMAKILFIVSLLGVFVTMMHTLGVLSSITEFSAFEIVMMVVMPLVVAAFLIWYSKLAERKSWIS